jgi:hypothetical protein
MGISEVVKSRARGDTRPYRLGERKRHLDVRSIKSRVPPVAPGPTGGIRRP